MSRISGTDLAAAQETVQGGPRDLRDLELDHFLQLMIAELENQDPLDPMDNSELLQQINQIREVSATDKLTETLEAVLTGQNLSNASSLIGKRVEALDDAAEEVSGIVDRISIEVAENGDGARELKLHIGDNQISLNNIRTVLPAEGTE